jgi:hypothetical protein
MKKNVVIPSREMSVVISSYYSDEILTNSREKNSKNSSMFDKPKILFLYHSLCNACVISMVSYPLLKISVVEWFVRWRYCRPPLLHFKSLHFLCCCVWSCTWASFVCHLWHSTTFTAPSSLQLEYSLLFVVASHVDFSHVHLSSGTRV